MKMLGILGLISLACCVGGCNFAMGLKQPPEEKIVFYGRVIDQLDNPIENAKVEIGVKHYDPFAQWGGGSKTVDLETDSDGLFTFKDKGWRIYISKIKKNSYEFLWEDTVRSYNYKKRGKYHIPDPDKPVVFHLRKEQEIVFYGKVVDQSGNPVRKAKVKIEVDYYDSFAVWGRETKTVNLETDSDGLFTLRDKGWDISIRQIRRRPYEFLQDDVKRSYSYTKDKKHIPNPDKPVVFHMRKN